MILKRINPSSLAKISSFIYAIAGLVIGLIVSIASITDLTAHQAGSSGVLFGVGAFVALPILYGVIGFFSSWLLAVVYNLVAKKIGGLEVDLQ